MALLGVKPGATLEQVGVAYRHMAQMYHPDKVVGLGPELQRLADERMKEINAAHQVVRRYLEAAGSTTA
jgi:curved DNA-binding protein CbpA